VLGLGCNIACFLASSSQKMAVVVVVVGCSKNSNIALRGLHHDDYNAVPSQHSNQSGATLRGISQKEQQTATIVETTRTTSQTRATAQHRQPQLKTAAPAATLATRGKTKLTNLQPQIAIIKKKRCQRANRAAAVSWKIPMHMFFLHLALFVSVKCQWSIGKR
jgi:hypothetical protein